MAEIVPTGHGPARHPYFFTPAGWCVVLVLTLALAGVSFLYAHRTVYEKLWLDATPKQIQAVLDKQVDAWNRGDLDGFMAGYWNSEELRFYSGNTVTTGWKATLERYRKKYKADGKEMGTLTFANVEIQTLGPDAAFVRGKWKVVTSKETFEGLFTLVVKNTTEGWRIVHDHTS